MTNEQQTNRPAAGFSIRTFFLGAMLLLIATLSLPLLLAGSHLMDRNIKEMGGELLHSKLLALLEPVERRYETLYRVGLEDSLVHRKEIKEMALAEFSAYRFRDSGSVFVLTPTGDILLSQLLSDSTDPHFLNLLARLNSADPDERIVAYSNEIGQQLAAFEYYQPWDSYVGLSIDHDELFAPKYLFLKINLMVLGAVLLVAALFVYGLQRLLIKPIIQLNHYAGHGFDDEQAKPPQAGFIMELATLRDSLVNMVATLQHRAREAAEQVKIISRREAELAAEREQLAVTLRSIGDGVITTDTTGRVILLNLVAERLTGWSQQEAQDRPLPEIFHIINDRTGEKHPNPVDKVLQTGLNVELENHTVLISRHGSRYHIADSGSPIRNFNSEIIGVVLVFRDVSEAIHTEAELLKAKKLESLGVLAAGIAHDFNNILTAIMGNLELARYLLGPQHQASNLIEEGTKASQRAQGLTQQLLTFARGGAPIRQAASIAGIIRDSADFVLRGSEVSCRYEIPHDLKLVNVDSGQISQVIQNIIINAREAISGSGTITVSCRNLGPVKKMPADEYVEIKISDSGSGISREEQGKIFDPYFTTKEKGSGLGLAVCHSIIAKHHGKISVESAPGQGCTFTILLPVANSAGIPAEADDRPAPAHNLSRRILLMDDEEMVRRVAARILQQLGCQVQETTDGEAAISAYRQAREEGQPFDLVIMDLTIPGGMGGKEAVKEIRRLDPQARVIVSSGYANDPIMAEPEKYGFDGVISKPYLLKDLEQVLANSKPKPQEQQP
ncbi:ATP-binding protein [Desulfurivibrio alkaliphilus]|uniref:histidine kinase n=1 Tax=Desulfurivibrio alkaliphilus (strain DSM 19089 / UNIQEM U267 / AHT2) TaxID=589865 RepID=D6YZW3_DESAT|nr:ATP-binding protein [Desulfurivibrio alkaliphilus]ADH85120.1 multi-sensor hybrid histidine kinase [Desulfurivibrio alkaliphilus AHT 2]